MGKPTTGKRRVQMLHQHHQSKDDVRGQRRLESNGVKNLLYNRRLMMMKYRSVKTSKVITQSSSSQLIHKSMNLKRILSNSNK